MEDSRRDALEAWARLKVPQSVSPDAQLVPASDDASFRRYFRFDRASVPAVFVDAPPELEDSRPFVRISAALVEAGLNAPVVHEFDEAAGFMMVTDLGTNLFLTALATDRRERLLASAVDALVTMQSVPLPLPPYDEAALQREMDLFPDWFLDRQLGITRSSGVESMLDHVRAALVTSALSQPVVFVHRDYHSRNLMFGDERPGILDFQDAVRGPVTYDLVSLLRDCYFRLPSDELDRWVEVFRDRVAGDVETSTFRRWFDLMGMQRHLKCAGIFSRLHLRDGKARYLGDIPLVIDYLVEAGSAWGEFTDLVDWLVTDIQPRLDELQQPA